MPSKVVVAAVDSSAGCLAAVEWLAANVARGAELRVLICAPQRQGAYSVGSPGASAELEAACRRRFPAAHSVEVVAARNGSDEAIGQAILARAHELNAVLVALAPGKRTASDRVLKGSVTDYCLRRGHLPVLVVQGVGQQEHRNEA